MTIRRKLFMVVFGELIMFSVTIAVLLISFLPILSINTEADQLKTLSSQVQLMRVEMNLIFSSPIEIQQDRLRKEKAELSALFDVIESQKELKNINKKAAESMEAILLLEGLFEERWETFDVLLDTVIGDAKKTLFSGTVPLIQFYKTDMIKRYGDYDAIMSRVGQLESSINITDGALRSAVEVIDTQFVVIETAISDKLHSLIIRALIISAILTSAIIVMALIVASGMVRSISRLEKSVSELKDGDLTADFNAGTKDEIGKLGQNLNDFASELSGSIQIIKNSAENNMKMKDELASSVEDSMSSAAGISDSVVEIRDGIVELDESVAVSGKEVTTVKNQTDDLKLMLQEQMAMIEESTSAVTEMITSIGNVGEITRKKKASAGELVKTAEVGGGRLDETIRIIQEITSSVDDIRGTASVIQSVAAQTSLLAMNAAIEAAHAGRYGAGFAVVAEEIRKLSEASGESSKKISGVLKDVVSSIESAAVSGEDTKKAFANINIEVAGVADALDEITGSMEELSAGGQQILEAMSSLQGYAVRVKDSGGAMSEASVGLEGAFRMVETVTTNILSRISGISRGVDEITAAVEIVSGISGRLSIEAEELNVGVARFNLGDERNETIDDAIADADAEELLAASGVDGTAD